MATIPSTPAHRKLVRAEILHLDEVGYGPQGLHTREDWRKDCYLNFEKGKNTFLKWQEKIRPQIIENLPLKSFGVVFHFDDGSKDTYQDFRVFSPYSLDLSNHTFEKIVIFPDYVFEEEVFFIGTIFLGDAYFHKCIFRREVFFEKSIVNDKANFDGVQFKKTATFTGCYFSNHAYFNNSVFNQKAKFFGTFFNENADFKSTQFENESLFYTSNFYGNVNFENAKFANVGHFEGVRFHTRTPSFRGCKVGDTLLEFSSDKFFPLVEKSEDAIKNISFLKRLADEHGQTDQALNFNAMELRAKRLQTEPKSAAWSFKAVTWLYEILSDYGRSFTRPIIFYALLIWLGFLYAYGHIDNTTEASISNSKLCEPKPLNLSREKAAVEYAMFRAGGLMDFTDTGKQNNAVNCRLFEEPIEPPLMRAWGIFKGIASIALLFLAALGLRNKYRIK
jgi:uncharacterized protein YjbI with pentapeptide repeats